MSDKLADTKGLPRGEDKSTPQYAYQTVKFGTMSQTVPDHTRKQGSEKDRNDRPAVTGVLNLAAR